MAGLKSFDIDGGYYFLTLVTHRRLPILVDLAGDFERALRRLKSVMGFECYAWVILPDHLHMVIEPCQCNLADIVKRLKLSVAFANRESRRMRRGKTWQARYWDHVIRDEEDMRRRLNYIVNNPVKHGLVTASCEWKWMWVMGIDS